MFTRAIVKKPSAKFCNGITSSVLGMPDLQKAWQQHNDYVHILQQCGLEITELEADELPDSCFVEDAAVVMDELAVITNPGAESRKKEITPVATVLKSFRPLAFIQSPGTMDGGDVMQVGTHFFIGISQRTNLEGAEQFKSIVMPFGYSCSFIPVKSVLHLKTGATYIGNNNLLAMDEFLLHPAFANFNVLPVPAAEAYAANAILINEKLVFPNGFPKTKAMLEKLNYNMAEVSMTEFEKMDGGLTCLSLRF
jgi:dimethylargininase